MIRLLQRIVCVVGLLGLTQAASAGVVVVVSSKSGVTSITKDQVADIYLGNSKNFPNGSSAMAADLPEGAIERAEFHKAVTGKSATQFKAYWAKMVFSGKGVPPKELATPAEMKSALAEHPNMIGYLDKSMVDSSLKIVLELN
jgi:ABC-type phosphate transport system substrate-binding protein